MEEAGTFDPDPELTALLFRNAEIGRLVREFQRLGAAVQTAVEWP